MSPTEEDVRAVERIKSDLQQVERLAIRYHDRRILHNARLAVLYTDGLLLTMRIAFAPRARQEGETT